MAKEITETEKKGALQAKNKDFQKMRKLLITILTADQVNNISTLWGEN